VSVAACVERKLDKPRGLWLAAPRTLDRRRPYREVRLAMGFLRRLLGQALRVDPDRGPIAPRDRAERPVVDLRGAVPGDGVLLADGPARRIVGESHYRAAIARQVGGRRASGTNATVFAALVREPGNRYDGNAVAVHIGGERCGYLTRAAAKSYGPSVERLAERGQVGYCRAEIRGGWRFDDGTWADYGVTLHVAKPKDLLASVESPPEPGKRV
jgi:hypothetical protein